MIGVGEWRSPGASRALTIAFARPALYNTTRGWDVLTVRLLVVAVFFLTLR